MISLISADDVLQSCRTSLCLPPSATPLDQALLAELVRRAAAFHCPCPSHELVRVVSDSLCELHHDDVRGQVATTVESLLVTGDLLDLSNATSLEARPGHSWLFAAPPSFVTLATMVVLLGIAGEDGMLVPEHIAERIKHRGFLRTIALGEENDLQATLREWGLIEVPLANWIKPPSLETAAACKDRLDRRLDEVPLCGAIADLQVLDGAIAPDAYGRRWRSPDELSGRFVARRPQRYGADLWGYVALENGQPQRFLDLPLRAARFRGCDVAWRLQSALDALRGTPQHYRIGYESDGQFVLTLTTPMPLWVKRRLSVWGTAVSRDRALLAFLLPISLEADVEVFLQDYMWLARY